MAGDQFSIKATNWYWWNGGEPGTSVNPLTDILAALISGSVAFRVAGIQV
jgi:hypothetical protein